MKVETLAEWPILEQTKKSNGKSILHHSRAKGLIKVAYTVFGGKP